MKKILFFLLAAGAAAIFSGCGLNSGNGELIGVQGRVPFKQVVPYGMVYIPYGTFMMGQTDQDIAYSQVSHNRQVTIGSFYMDDTEITNNEYRQFVEWVKDSIAHKLLGGDYITTTDDGKEYVNYKKQVKFDDPENADALSTLYYPENERVFGKKEIDTRKLIYHVEFMDFYEAANKGNRDKPRQSFIKKDDLSIYPDTLCWLADFAYAMNEPMVEKYFWHPGYDDYPVVGVSWRQARAFCVWRSSIFDDFRIAKGDVTTNKFRLPTEAEWEYAARGGRNGADYPWGGPYIRNSKGCLLANFKPNRGNYIDDGGFYSVKVRLYFPNDYGLYCMSGNVAEWTSTAYTGASYNFVHDLNPTYQYEAKPEDPLERKRKVVRGGSWKDIGYFLQNGTRSYEYQDTSKSYIGFRCAMSYIGRSIEDEK